MFVLLLLIFLSSSNAIYDLKSPQIRTENGNLFITPGYGKNLTLENFGPNSRVLISDVDVLKLINTVKLQTQAFKRAESNMNLIFDKMPDFEQLYNSSSRIMALLNQNDNDTNAVKTPRFTQRFLRGTRRRLRSLEQNVNRITTLLNTNECSSTPCKNGATCIDAYNGYQCLCTSNWQGEDCSNDVNECDTLSGTTLGCQNGATCLNMPGSFSCQCSSGWHGTLCTTHSTQCSSSSNFEMCGHGTCVQQGTKYSCICDAGWKTDGVRPECSTDINECEGNRHPCSATPYVPCMNIPGGFVCGSCPTGYSGNGYYCSDIDECQINNGGCSMLPLVQCINTMGSRMCGPCPPGYEGNGVTCEFKGLCHVNNGGCHPFAMCTSNQYMGPTFVRCICHDGYTGSGVGINGCVPITPGTVVTVPSMLPKVHCNPNPCVHGFCHDGPRGYLCICETRYTGKNCDQPRDPCVPQPCKNGGTCISDLPTLGFRCECPSRYTGTTCQTSVSSCGSILDNAEGSLEYPEANETNYGHNSRCAWVIKTENDKVLNVTFTKFNLEPSADCLYDWLQVHDGRNSASHVIGRFCGTTPPKGNNIISTSNTLYLWFRSDHTVANRGFALHWTSIPPVCGGRIENATYGTISSPGSPGLYPPNRDCYWKIIAAPDKRIQLTFFTLQIENNSDCSKDFLAIYDGLSTSDPLLVRYCITMHPPPLLVPSPNALIYFHSDASNNDYGFQMSYASVEGIPGCGGFFTNDKGEITPPTLQGKYVNNMECEYKIRFAPESRIKLTFLEFNLESSSTCTYDHLEVYDGDSTESKMLGRYCGDTVPPVILSSTNNLLLMFKSDWSLSKKGFKILYEIVCHRVFTALTGQIQSPNYPKTYAGNKHCTYLITLPPKKAIRLSFIDFDIEGNSWPKCSYDNLKVFDGDHENSTLIGQYCGRDDMKPDDIISSFNYLYLEFNTDESIGGTGFQANYSSIDLACGGVMKTTSGHIELPETNNTMDITYSDNMLCKWVISAPYNHKIQVSWLGFDLEKTSDCDADYIEIYENDTMTGKSDRVGRYCGSTLPPSFTSNGNLVTIVFQSDLSVTSQGFSLTYVITDSNRVCGGTYLVSSGVITSPGWPNTYPTVKSCTWTIRVENGHQIVLNFTAFDLEQYINCDADYVEIKSGDYALAPLIGRFCGNNTPPIIKSMTNSLYIKFHSDISKVSSGFYATWESTTTGCGGVLKEPKGSIISPNYPQPYGSLTECYWKITVSLGSVIEITFGDLDLEVDPECLYDYIEIFDSVYTETGKLGKYCSSQNLPSHIKTSFNHAYIKFTSDSFTAGRGFLLNYITNCNVELTGFSGIIESMNFPEEYPPNMNCTWKISVPRGNRINVTFSHFELEESRETPLMSSFVQSILGFTDCVQLKDGRDEKYPTKYTYRGSNIPPRYTSSDNVTFIHFFSDDYLNYPGFRLEWTLFGCGGYLRRPEGVLSSPGGQNRYAYDVQCDWKIEVDQGKSIQLTISKFEASDKTQCMTTSPTLAVYNGIDASAPMLIMICNTQTEVHIVTTTGNFMFVRFLGDRSVGKRFKANYITNDSKCGGVFSGVQGTIHSPNYPKNYPANTNCFWYISVNKDHLVNLTFNDFDLYGSECESSIKIYNDHKPDNSSLIKQFCGDNVTRNLTVFSLTNKLLVQMTTNTLLSAKGFRATYTMSCGRKITTSTQGVISPNIEMWTGLDVSECTWIIVGENTGDRVSLTFTHLELPHYSKGNVSCNTQYVELFNGESTTSPSIGKYCGSQIPPQIISKGNAMTIMIKSQLFQKGYFTAEYSVIATACGGTLTSEHGSFTSPQYPSSYPVNSVCVWQLNTSPGNQIQVSFEAFDIEQSDDCNQDYLEIRENNATGKIIGVFCGSDIPSTVTTDKVVWIKFASDEDSTAKGFVAHYSFVHGNEIQDESSGSISSPLYPKSYSKSGSFYWRINVIYGMTIRITFKEFELGHSNDDDSCTSFLAIYDGYDDRGMQLMKSCGNTLPDAVETETNVVYIELKNADFEKGIKFLLDWNRVSTEDDYTEIEKNNTCGSDTTLFVPITGAHGLKSPGYPYGYAHSIECSWTFETESSHHFSLKFLTVDMEEEENCILDKISVYSGNKNSNDWIKIGDYCKPSDVDKKINSTGNLMKVVFETDSSSNKTGFNAIIYPECGGTMEDRSGTLKPSYQLRNSPLPKISFPHEYTCIWKIKVRPGRTIKLTFVEFNITNTDENVCKNYIMLRNGYSEESPLLGKGKYCGTTVPTDALITTSNYLYVKFEMTKIFPFRPLDKTFTLQYSEQSIECGARTKLTHELNSTEISTPNYPDIPNPYTECSWLFTAPAGERIRIDFLERFDLSDSEDCVDEFLEIRDGGTEHSDLLVTLCAGKMPDTQRTTGNFMFIRYITNIVDPRNGFKARISIDICGGTMRGTQGVIKSPSNTQLFSVQTDLLCEWYIEVPVDHFIWLDLKVKLCDDIDECDSCTKGNITVFDTTPLNKTEMIETKVTCETDDKTLQLASTSNAVYIQFVGEKNILKDSKYNFEISYNASKEVCGGLVTEPSGYLRGPKSFSTGMRFCNWKIEVPEDRRITIQITSEVAKNSLDQRIDFFNDFQYRALLKSGFQIARENGTQTIESSSNRMMVYYWIKKSVDFQPFVAHYTSDKPSLCSGRTLQNEGVILPPSEKAITYYCEYSYIKPDDDNRETTLVIKVSDIFINSTANNRLLRITCFFSPSRITITEGQYFTVAEVCNNLSEPKIIRFSSANEIMIKVNNQVPNPFNYRIEYKVTACGGNIKNPKETIELTIPEIKEGPIDCAWKLFTPIQDTIEISTSNMVLSSDSCDSEFFSWYNKSFGRSKQITKVCADNNSTKTSHRASQVILEYHADKYYNTTKLILNIEYTSSGCGTLLSFVRRFQTPNYPKNYRNNQECLWEIVAEKGYKINLGFINRFYIEKTANCSKDYVEILDRVKDTWVSKGRFCGREIPNNFTSTSNKMNVVFRSDSTITADGFQASWTPFCGGTMEATTEIQTITSPGYPRYGRNLNCEYIIKASEHAVNINFTQFSLESGKNGDSCGFDNLTIIPHIEDYMQYDKKVYCGKNSPGFARYQNGLRVIFATDRWVQKEGFIFTYSIDSCGGNITEPQRIVLLSKEDFSHKNCIWNITAPTDKIVVIRFTKLKLPHSISCDFTKLTAYEGNKMVDDKRIAILCGDLNRSPPMVKSKSNKMLLHLYNEFEQSGISYSADVVFARGETSGCGGEIFVNGSLTKDFKTSNSDSYENFLECDWLIKVPKGYVVQFKFTSFRLAPCNNATLTSSKRNNCTCDYLEVRDGGGHFASLIGKYCGYEIPKEITSSKDQMYVRLVTDSTDVDSGVRGVIKALPSVCGKRMIRTSDTSLLLPPLDSEGNVLRGVRCTWIISHEQNIFNKLHVIISDVDLVKSVDGQCSVDKLEIANALRVTSYVDDESTRIISGFEPGYHFGGSLEPTHYRYALCGKIPYLNFYTSKSKFVVRLTTSAEGQKEHKGFKIEFRENECSYNYTAESGRFNWNYYKNSTLCNVIIAAPENRTISMYFKTINSWSEDNSIEVRDGETDTSALLVKIQGGKSLKPLPVFSTKNKMLVSLRMKPLSHFHAEGLYVTTDKGRGCGGNIFAADGIIYSPMYPMAYRGPQPCEWIIQTPLETMVTISFEFFDIGNRMMCETDYLTFIDSSGNTIQKYCPGDDPATWRGNSNYVKIVQHASSNGNGNGWTIRFYSRHYFEEKEETEDDEKDYEESD